MTDCPNCEYHKQRAARWRAEAYKHAGYDIELPWVGLTDEEKLVANQMWRVMDADGFIKAIEAKLKEKNT